VRIELLGDVYHYESFGDARGVPVVFLHGFSQSARTWHPVVERMLRDPRASGLRLLLLDLVGHGASDKPDRADAYAFAHIIEVLERLRTELGLGRMHLVGYSMGGRIALLYALRRPDALRSLVVESASFGPRSRDEAQAMRERDAALAERLARSTPEEFADWWASMPLFATQSELPEAVQAAERAMRAANDTKALARVAAGCGQGTMPSVWEDVAALPVPVHYLVGERDERYAAIASEAAVRWGLDVRSFPTGHNVHLESPERYALALLDIFSDEQERP
jgi:2-succinyl-6-hydroxy-2,4-cyclohexadiene-1-carboxylate synthase